MIEVRDVIKEDIPEALRISAEELGDDYLAEEDFLETMEPGDAQFCKVVLLDGKVAGFAICQVFGPEKEAEKLKLPDCPERDEVMQMSKIGLLDSVSIDNSLKGHGLGTALCNECVREMRDMGCEMLCAMAWKSYKRQETNIAPILRKFGMEETIQIQGYWNSMVDTPGGQHCPECGTACKCYGVFWKRRI